MDGNTEMKTGAGVEPYTPLTPGAALGGRRRKSLKLVTKKKARKVLKKLGMKLRGGNTDPNAPVAVPKEDIETAEETTEKGGRRHKRGTKKTHRKGKGKKRSLFGMRY